MDRSGFQCAFWGIGMTPPRECMPCVLVVEDDPLSARLLRSGLERRSRVAWARTLTGARRLLGERVFDLVVTDLQLGGDSGRGIPALARLYDPRTPVILVSGHPSIARVAAEVRADAWIPKPVRLDALRRAAASLLARGSPPAGGGSTHAMVLFDSDAERLEAASTFVADGLRSGRRAVAVLDRRLHAPMKDLVLRKSGSGRFRLVAAEALLEQVIRAGTASRKRFAALAADLLGSAEPLRFFGDAVDHLACRGAHRAALQLEALWNEALPPSGLELLCGYSRAGLEAAPCGCLRDLVGRHQRSARAV